MASLNAPSESAVVPQETELTPDPDEDELDGLDGMGSKIAMIAITNQYPDLLDDFSVTTAKPTQVDPASSRLREELFEDLSMSEIATEFSKRLHEQMAALMGSVDESSEMRTEIETSMQDLVGVTDVKDATGKNPASLATASADFEKPFQETIRRTMERMQASGDQAKAAAAAQDPDDIIAHMLEEMQNGGLDGPADEEGFSKMLLGMMEQLTNKDILYEPMKELHDKFPAWMLKHESNIREDDLERYRDQKRLVGEIVRKFDENGYSDSNPADREFIVERMQQASLP